MLGKTAACYPQQRHKFTDYAWRGKEGKTVSDVYFEFEQGDGERNDAK